MKQFYKRLMRLLLVVVFLTSFAQVGVGQTTVTYDFSDGSAVSGLNEAAPGISLDANIGFGSFKNGGTANPVINSGQLRLYQNATKGGSIKIYANNGVTITRVIVHASGTTGPAAYTVDGGSATALSSSTTYTMSGLSATSEVEFYQKDGSSSNRIYVDYFEVTYTSAATGSSTVTVATNGEPLTLSSLTTALTGASSPQLNAVSNFNFTFTDDGNDNTVDGIATDITDIVIKQGTGNDITDWTEAIAGAQLSDGSNTATATVNATDLTFASIGTLGDIADDGNKIYTLKIWLKTSLGGTLPTTIDGLNFVFLVDNSSFTFGATSSGLDASQTQNSGSGNNAIIVVEKELHFVQQPSNTATNGTMSPAVTIEATDENENRDLGSSKTVSLTSSGTMGAVSNISLSSGFGTFGNIIHSVAGTGLVLTATATGLTDGTSTTFVIADDPCSVSNTLTYSEGFNSTSIPSCWNETIVNDPGTDPNLSYVASESNPTVLPSEGTDFVNFNSYNCPNGAEIRLESPPISTSSYTNVYVHFDWFESDGYSTYTNEGVTVQYSIDDGANWTDVTFYQRYNATEQWVTKNCLLPVAAEDVADLRIAFLFHSQYGEDCNLDNVIVDATLACATPSSPATLGNITNIGSDRMDVNWTRGNGDNVIVIARQGSAVAFTPTDLNTYAANSSFGSGTDLGSGQYCVYNGSGTSVTVTGLAGSTNYQFAVYEYGCSAGNELYLTSSPATASGTTTAPAPEINVNQAGTDYLHNSTYDFGSIEIGNNSPITFTIENTGNANLTFSALTISGSADYAVTTQPSSPIAGGGTSDFVITFTPSSVGTITGSVSIDNNDATGSEDPYVVKFTAVGTPSASSDIIVKSAFDEPDNIEYVKYQSTNIVNDGNDIEVAQFTIRDGGATNDADGFATELTDITFSVSNSSFLRRIAIYDGTTEVAEVATGSSITFSGISLSATDNSEKTFSLRASFSTTVTDNQQIQFTVTAATANSATSTFAAADAGGAVSSIAGDDNKIEVVAKNLFFDNQPSTTSKNGTMTAVTVIATDDNLITDLDFIGNVTITSTGTMTGDPVSVAASSGTATFSSIVHTVAGTNFTLTATATGLLQDISSTFDITEFVYQNGDYRSTADYTDLSHNNNAGATNYWEYYDGTSWGTTPGDLSPQNAGTTPTRVIINNVGVTGGGNTSNSYNDIIILNGAELILNDYAATPSAKFIASGKMLEVQSGGTLEIIGNFDKDGDLIVRNGGLMKINSPNMRNDDEMWNGTENFEAGSTVQIDDWDWTGTATYRSLINIVTAITDNSQGYKFGYFILNKTTTESANWTIIGGSVGIVNLCYNDFTINNSGDDWVGGISNKTGTNGFVVNGDFIVNSGNFAFSTNYSTGDYNHQPVINGNFEYNGSKTLMMHFNAIGTVATNTYGYTTFKGDVSVASTATIANDPDASSVYMPVYFNGTSPQDVDIETSLSHTDMYVKSGATARLVYDMDLTGTNSILTVDNGGIWQIIPNIDMTAPSGGIVNNASSNGFVIKSDATGTGSLIQQDAFAATYERYLTGGANVWHDIFSPLSAANLPSGYIYSYDESKQDIWNMTTNFGWDGSNFVANNSEIGWVAASSLATTQGYILSVDATKTISLTGGNLEVNDKTFSTQTTTHSGIIPTSGNDPNGVSYSGCVNNWNDYDGWVFVGNPYASALDWSVAYSGDADLESGLYIWDDGAKNYKYFLDPDGSNSTFTVGINVNGDGNTQYIPSGQGFFVKSANASGSFTIPATARTHTTHAFWKEDDETLSNLLRLNISKDDYTDETVLFSVNGATDNFDGGFDLHKRFSMDNTVPQIYSMNDGQSQFALNSFPEITGSKVVPLGVYTGIDGEYSINMTQNNFADIHVWLEDRYNNKFIDFSQPNSYTFNQSVETNNDRFYIHFDKNTAPYVTYNVPDQVTLVKEKYVYVLPKSIFADDNFNDELTIVATLANGNDLPNWLVFDAKTGEFAGTPADTATYSIKITATDKFGATAVEDFKLQVYKLPTSVSNIDIQKMISVFPNPAHDIINVVVPEVAVNSSINIYDAAGKKVLVKNIVSETTSIDVSNFANGVYVIEIKNDMFSSKQKLIIK